MLYYASRPQPESNLSVKYERDGFLTVLSSFKLSLRSCERRESLSMAHGQVLTGFWWPSERASHVKRSTGAPERAR